MLSDRLKIALPLLVFALVFPLMAAVFPAPSSVRDAYSYTMTAQRLVVDGVYAFSAEPPGVPIEPNAVVTPGWPLVLAGIYGVAGWEGDAQATAEAARPLLLFVMFLCSLSTVAAVAASARALGGPGLGLAAGLVAALYPPLSWAGTVVLAENLGASLFMWQIYAAIKLSDVKAKRGTRELLLFGALCAATLLVRPNLALWMLALAAYVLVRRIEPPRRFVRLLGVALVGFALLIVPWWARNIISVGAFIPVKSNYGVVPAPSTSGGAASTAGSDASGGEYWEVTTPAVNATRIAQPWVPFFEVLYEESYNPQLPRITYQSGTVAPTEVGDAMAIAALWYHRVLLLLAAASLVFVRRSPRLLLLAAAPVAVLAVHWSHLTTRYMYPTMPALLVMATLGGYGIWRWARQAYRRRRSPG